MKYFFILAFFISVQDSFAFNWKKCTSQGLGSMSIFGISTSSGQFTSSTGGCSMLGLVEHDQKLFIAQAYEPLQIDLARGEGEFLDAFAEISKCNSLGKIGLKKELQKNYGNIYDDESLDDIEKTRSRILNVMRSDQVIGKNCRFGPGGKS